MFAAISVDETAQFHEDVSRFLRYVWNPDGVLHFPWVAPAIVLILAVAITYGRFVIALPRRIRWQVVAAASMFVGGSVGVEIIGGRHAASFGAMDFEFAMLATLEEGLELMAGVVFLRAFLEYLDGAAVHTRIESGTSDLLHRHAPAP